jgi:hypothetical protein
LKISQGEVLDFSSEVQKFSGEVQNDLRGGAHLPSKSGHVYIQTSVNFKTSEKKTRTADPNKISK